jgi:alpha-tubulin suppressor-like RCC1 family protein
MMLRRILASGAVCVGLAFVGSRLTAGTGGSGGNGFTALLLSDGGVWTAGQNDNGEIGDGTTDERLARTSVLTGVVSIASGSAHSAAALADGSVRAWGAGNSGQLGDDTQYSRYVPTAVPGSRTSCRLRPAATSR